MDKLITRGTVSVHGNERRFTLVGLYDQEEVRVGLATCSEKDNFSKKIGRNIATHRAINRPTEVISFDEMPYEGDDKKRVLSLLCAIRDMISANPQDYYKPYLEHFEKSTSFS